jgi:hypothetical protein
MKYYYSAAGLEEVSINTLWFRERLTVGMHIVACETRNEYRVTWCAEPLTELEVGRLVSDGGFNLCVERLKS